MSRKYASTPKPAFSAPTTPEGSDGEIADEDEDPTLSEFEEQVSSLNAALGGLSREHLVAFVSRLCYKSEEIRSDARHFLRHVEPALEARRQAELALRASRALPLAPRTPPWVPRAPLQAGEAARHHSMPEARPRQPGASVHFDSEGLPNEGQPVPRVRSPRKKSSSPPRKPVEKHKDNPLPPGYTEQPRKDMLPFQSDAELPVSRTGDLTPRGHRKLKHMAAAARASSLPAVKTRSARKPRSSLSARLRMSQWDVIDTSPSPSPSSMSRKIGEDSELYNASGEEFDGVIGGGARREFGGDNVAEFDGIGASSRDVEGPGHDHQVSKRSRIVRHHSSPYMKREMAIRDQISNFHTGMLDSRERSPSPYPRDLGVSGSSLPITPRRSRILPKGSMEYPPPVHEGAQEDEYLSEEALQYDYHQEAEEGAVSPAASARRRERELRGERDASPVASAGRRNRGRREEGSVLPAALPRAASPGRRRRRWYHSLKESKLFGKLLPSPTRGRSQSKPQSLPLQSNGASGVLPAIREMMPLAGSGALSVRASVPPQQRRGGGALPAIREMMRWPTFSTGSRRRSSKERAAPLEEEEHSHSRAWHAMSRKPKSSAMEEHRKSEDFGSSLLFSSPKPQKNAPSVRRPMLLLPPSPRPITYDNGQRPHAVDTGYRSHATDEGRRPQALDIGRRPHAMDTGHRPHADEGRRDSEDTAPRARGVWVPPPSKPLPQFPPEGVPPSISLSESEKGARESEKGASESEKGASESEKGANSSEKGASSSPRAAMPSLSPTDSSVPAPIKLPDIFGRKALAPAYRLLSVVTDGPGANGPPSDSDSDAARYAMGLSRAMSPSRGGGSPHTGGFSRKSGREVGELLRSLSIEGEEGRPARDRAVSQDSKLSGSDAKAQRKEQLHHAQGPNPSPKGSASQENGHTRSLVKTVATSGLSSIESPIFDSFPSQDFAPNSEMSGNRQEDENYDADRSAEEASESDGPDRRHATSAAANVDAESDSDVAHDVSIHGLYSHLDSMRRRKQVGAGRLSKFVSSSLLAVQPRGSISKSLPGSLRASVDKPVKRKYHSLRRESELLSPTDAFLEQVYDQVPLVAIDAEGQKRETLADEDGCAIDIRTRAEGPRARMSTALNGNSEAYFASLHEMWNGEGTNTHPHPACDAPPRPDGKEVKHAQEQLSATTSTYQKIFGKKSQPVALNDGHEHVGEHTDDVSAGTKILSRASTFLTKLVSAPARSHSVGSSRGASPTGAAVAQRRRAHSASASDALADDERDAPTAPSHASSRSSSPFYSNLERRAPRVTNAFSFGGSGGGAPSRPSPRSGGAGTPTPKMKEKHPISLTDDACPPGLQRATSPHPKAGRLKRGNKMHLPRLILSRSAPSFADVTESFAVHPNAHEPSRHATVDEDEEERILRSKLKHGVSKSHLTRALTYVAERSRNAKPMETPTRGNSAVLTRGNSSSATLYDIDDEEGEIGSTPTLGSDGELGDDDGEVGDNGATPGARPRRKSRLKEATLDVKPSPASEPRRSSRPPPPRSPRPVAARSPPPPRSPRPVGSRSPLPPRSPRPAGARSPLPPRSPRPVVGSRSPRPVQVGPNSGASSLLCPPQSPRSPRRLSAPPPVRQDSDDLDHATRGRIARQLTSLLDTPQTEACITSSDHLHQIERLITHKPNSDDLSRGKRKRNADADAALKQQVSSRVAPSIFEASDEDVADAPSKSTCFEERRRVRSTAPSTPNGSAAAGGRRGSTAQQLRLKRKDIADMVRFNKEKDRTAVENYASVAEYFVSGDADDKAPARRPSASSRRSLALPTASSPAAAVSSAGMRAAPASPPARRGGLRRGLRRRSFNVDEDKQKEGSFEKAKAKKSGGIFNKVRSVLSSSKAEEESAATPSAADADEKKGGRGGRIAEDMYTHQLNFEWFLKEPMARRFFHIFLKSQLANENLEFHTAEKEYEGIKDPELRRKRFYELWEEFIDESAEKQVNISAKYRTALDAKKREIDAGAEPSRSVYLSASESLVRLLKLPFVEFTKSKEYRAYIREGSNTLRPEYNISWEEVLSFLQSDALPSRLEKNPWLYADYLHEQGVPMADAQQMVLNIVRNVHSRTSTARRTTKSKSVSQRHALQNKPRRLESICKRIKEDDDTDSSGPEEPIDRKKAMSTPPRNGVTSSSSNLPPRHTADSDLHRPGGVAPSSSNPLPPKHTATDSDFKRGSDAAVSDDNHRRPGCLRRDDSWLFADDI